MPVLSFQYKMIHVTICRQQKHKAPAVTAYELPEGATLAVALEAAGLPPDTAAGIFCEKVTPGTPLKSGDRIDVARDLLTDPKTARRLRAEVKERQAVPKPRHGGIHQLIKPLDTDI